MQPAFTTGELRPYHAHQMRLSVFPLPADDDFQFPENTDLSYTQTPNGVLVTYDHLLVAWIFKGHTGSRNNQRRVQFWDVSSFGGVDQKWPVFVSGQGFVAISMPDWNS